MLIGPSKYNYYHIRANRAQTLSACIHNFSGRIYMTNHRHAVHNKKSMGLSSVIGHQLAPGRPDESWHRTTLSSSTFYGQNIQFTVPKASVISGDRWPPHLQTQYPSRTLKSNEKWLGLLDEGSTHGQRSNPASRKPVDNKKTFKMFQLLHFLQKQFDGKFDQWPLATSVSISYHLKHLFESGI